MRRFSAPMTRPPSKRSIDLIPCCRFLRLAPNDMDLSATATEHCRSMRPSTPAPAQSSVKRLLATPPRNSSPFLGQLIALENKGGDIHIILDNLSTHKTQRVRDFLAEHPNVLLHFTPTYSSWLNQVEIWFSKIERDAIARGVFTSVGD